MLKLKFRKSAKKELMNLEDDVLVKAWETIFKLRENPYLKGFDKVEGKKNQLRYWITKYYRILYQKDKDALIVVAVGKKEKDFYSKNNTG